jgi:hypothetical protein
VFESWVNIAAASKKDVTGSDKDISIEMLEGQLNQLKSMFEEKQKLVKDLEACGPSELEVNDLPEVHEAPVE